MAKKYTDKSPFVLPRHIQYKNGVNVETISANKDLSYSDSQYQILTNSKGSTAVVKTPAKKNGAMFYIKCQTGSAHALHIKDADGVDIIGSPFLAAGKLAILVCDGSTWSILFEQA